MWQTVWNAHQRFRGLRGRWGGGGGEIWWRNRIIKLIKWNFLKPKSILSPNKEILLVCRRNLVLLRVLGKLHVLKLLWGKFQESRLAQKFKIALKKFKTSSFHWYFYSIMKIFDLLTCFKMLFLKFDLLKDIFWDLNFRRKFPLKLCFNIRHGLYNVAFTIVERALHCRFSLLWLKIFR